ncbi:MAG: alpha-ketoglutarate-dependent dioxygenase AlkB [Wenzhouxiangella sp.]|nr:MAG: alpha-ketoglutarate-dependent dioxygenase AlkB [Wenzhouxiangella sp.]
MPDVPDNNSRTSPVHLPPGGTISYTERWLSSDHAARLCKQLLESLHWRQLPVYLFGRWIPQPRLTDFHGDPGTCYSYAGLDLRGRGWPGPLAELREAVALHTGQRFNTVLCNLYRNGNDYMGWHADDERELGRDPIIASVSLGASRRFLLRPRRGERGERREFVLASGSLLVMAGDLQHHWQHQLPKALRVGEPRINLTFRQVSG